MKLFLYVQQNRAIVTIAWNYIEWSKYYQVCGYKKIRYSKRFTAQATIRTILIRISFTILCLNMCPMDNEHLDAPVLRLTRPAPSLPYIDRVPLPRPFAPTTRCHPTASLATGSELRNIRRCHVSPWSNFVAVNFPLDVRRVWFTEHNHQLQISDL